MLFDRDGTLIEDVAYNSDPGRVFPLPGAREAVAEVRARGLAVGVVTNQSGVARGLLTRRQVDNVNRRVEELFGPFDVWAVCPHGPEDGCECRKPEPGLVQAAARSLGLAPSRVAVVGDIGADLWAAYAAGATGVLVPTSETLQEEIETSPQSATDLPTAVHLLLGVALPADADPDRGGPEATPPEDTGPERDGRASESARAALERATGGVASVDGRTGSLRLPRIRHGGAR